MFVSKLGRRRQVVIPRAICEAFGLEAGDFIEVKKTRTGIVVKPKKPVDPDDTLTPAEEKIVLRGEEQLRCGEFVNLEELERDLERSARKRRQKSA